MANLFGNILQRSPSAGSTSPTSFSADGGMETSQQLPVNDDDVTTTQNEEFDNDGWHIGESESDLNVRRLFS